MLFRSLNATNPAVVFNFRFPGQYADSETGQFYNYYRNYLATQGRYTQNDPIGLSGGPNRYLYANANPLMYTDAMGLQALAGARLGAAGEGFKVAMRTLDIFRTSVAAAALGFGRKALDEALARATTRQLFGGVLSDLQLTQVRLAQMATTIDSAALLTYRAAWMRDCGQTVTREAAMAKLVATEGAQEVIDAAVQLLGGLGVMRGNPVEQLYREVRSLRIYEGASEVQQLIIGRDLLRAWNEETRPHA